MHCVTGSGSGSSATDVDAVDVALLQVQQQCQNNSTKVCDPTCSSGINFFGELQVH